MSESVASVVRRMRAAGFTVEQISRTVRLPEYDVARVRD